MYSSVAPILFCLGYLSRTGQSQPVNQTTSDSQYSIDWNPTYEYSTFSYYPNPSKTYATPNPKANSTTYYAPHYTDVAGSLLGNISTTTWGNWDHSTKVNATDSDDPYGNYAWTKMWEDASIKNYTNSALYSTTVTPTAIPSSDLILPPEDSYSFDDTLKFPSGFIFGVAGSAAQIEGAIADEGRTPTILETGTMNDNKSNDYVTNENYYLYKQDIVRIAAMGVKYYSFTIPWTRIMPFVLPNTPVNKLGIDHYDDLINTCLEYGITPIATLTHFDSPLMFNQGNFTANSTLFNNAGYDNDTFVDAFVNYGKIVLSHYADRVPIWIGFNEPFLYAGNAVGVKHVIQATAQLHKFYHEELKATGKFGIKFNDNFGVPKDPTNEDDVAAANRFQELYLGSFANALFLGKDYPDSWKDTFSDTLSEFSFTEDELKDIKGGADFFGIDPYTYTVVSAPEGGIEACAANSSDTLWPYCVVQEETAESGWAIGYRSQSYVYITPTQLREFLNYIWDTFEAPVFVTEFGFPEWREAEKELKDQVFDENRSIYYRSFMQAILQAINLDKVQVIGALAWSFADNWEFGDYTQQFGLQVVNRTTQERHYKKSFFDLVKFIEDRR
ncbi:hypothetical protein CLIB1423_02S12112 [[Candida] railenensis]|uniref:Beta-glucosidase n=1 Tax=[Candida] railenensis TaxID=45579 RepID=A0A9P0QM87_9ASCO|nr:hypothetical protein CLIB1423_02S12112 [[Candida] railenensis]